MKNFLNLTLSKLTFILGTFYFTLFFLNSRALAQDVSIISVGEAEMEKEKVAILPVGGVEQLNAKHKEYPSEIYEIMTNDFSFYRKNFEVPNYSQIGPSLKELTSPTPHFDFWLGKNARFVISSALTYKKEGAPANSDMTLLWTTKLYNVAEKKEILQIEKVLTEKNKRQVTHEVSDQIYKKLTGKDSVFLSKLVFVCDGGTILNKHSIKELFQSDFDGYNLEQLTHHKGLVISPGVGPTRSHIVYSLIQNNNKVKNVDLYLLDTTTGISRPISQKKGINSGGVFFPDNQQIALSLTTSGNADIYLMDIKTGKLRRLTSHPSDDVDPSFTPDGTKMAFLSGRAGRATIYTMDTASEEKNVTRISYVGKFNSSPRFSPDGAQIAFASWVDSSFDIFRISSDGMNLVRLTKNFGQCEDPSFSPDGEFIVFSSTRILSKSTSGAAKNIYIMDRDGDILGPVTKNLGNCTTPRWVK